MITLSQRDELLCTVATRLAQYKPFTFFIVLVVTVLMHSSTVHCGLCIMCSGGSGVISCYDDIARFRRSTSCSSVMLARAAQWNPSVFSHEGLQPITRIIQQYITYVSSAWCSCHCCLRLTIAVFPATVASCFFGLYFCLHLYSVFLFVISIICCCKSLLVIIIMIGQL